MRCAILSVLVLTTASVVGAPAPFPKQDRRTEWEKLQGEWELVGIVFDGGRQRVRKEQRGLVITATGSWVCFGGSCAVRIDNRSEPKRMDFAFQDGTLLCIYRLDGGTLTIRRGTTEERPKDFNIDSGSTRVETFILERMNVR